MNDDRYAIVVDISTQWFTHLVQYELTTENTEIKAVHDIPDRVTKTPFCKNIFERPNDIDNNWEMVIGASRGFYGWHVGKADYERIAELIRASKVVDRFEKLSQIGG